MSKIEGLSILNRNKDSQKRFSLKILMGISAAYWINLLVNTFRQKKSNLYQCCFLSAFNVCMKQKWTQPCSQILMIHSKSINLLILLGFHSTVSSTEFMEAFSKTRILSFLSSYMVEETIGPRKRPPTLYGRSLQCHMPTLGTNPRPSGDKRVTFSRAIKAPATSYLHQIAQFWIL